MVVNHLLDGKWGGRKPRLALVFHVVITESAKPPFFQTDSRSPLFEVALMLECLMNKDNGTPIGASDSMDNTGSFGTLAGGGNGRAAHNQIFQGRTSRHLNRFFDILPG